MSTTLTSLADLADLVMLQLPGCPYALALDGLKQTARDVCRRTKAWLEEIEVTTVAGTLSYALAVPSGALLQAIEGVETADGGAIATGGLRLTPPATLVFADDPGAAELVVTCICQPSGAEVPDWLVTTERDALTFGAIAVRKRDAAKPWSGQDWPTWQAQYDQWVQRLAVRLHGDFTGQYQTALQGVRVL